MMYDMPLYRPPSEAYSLIIQATLGCSHNKCTFCNMYKSKQFVIKPLEKIKEEINYFRKQYRNVEKIFLADGDALIIPMNELKEIFQYIKEVFPECKRIILYGSPKSILNKTIDELKMLKELGLYMIYMGVESGDENTLKYINKGATTNEILKAAIKVKESGVLLSVTVIAGLAGKKDSKNHAINTGRLISKISPDFLGVLTLMISEDTYIYKEIKNGNFEILSDIEILEEIKTIIDHINVKNNLVFRCNHASNYLLLRGNLPFDKVELIESIKESLQKNNLRCEDTRML